MLFSFKNGHGKFNGIDDPLRIGCFASDVTKDSDTSNYGEIWVRRE